MRKCSSYLCTALLLLSVISAACSQAVAQPAIQEDCIPFNNANTQVTQISGRWKVVDGNMWLLDFTTHEDQARKALSVIKFYGMNSQCFVGRPNAPMQYYLVNGRAPWGPMAGEDALSFSNANVEAKQINGTWKVVDGSHWMLDFGTNENNARTAVALIKKYGFSYICFVGRPNAPMMYFRTDAPKITSTLTAAPVSYSGPYPTTIKFAGQISVSTPCDVKYTFLRSDGATGPTKTLKFTSAGSMPVEETWTLGLDYSGWEQIKILSPTAALSNRAAFQTKIKEDCIPFNNANVQVKQISGRWKIVDGNMWLLDFNTSEDQARKALAVIKFYGMNAQCFVGRPNAPMQYYLKNGAAPSGAMAGEDAIAFNNANIEAKQINGTWKVVDGNHWMLDFGTNENNARMAVSIIKKYGFSYICFVGRPNPPMMYFRK